MYESINKDDNINLLNQYMYAKTLSMFEWEGLPETIPQRELEKLLQVHGYAFITKFKGELYAFIGGLGGECDAYGNATQIIINNPYLKFNKTLDIKKDGVLIINDDLKLGLEPFFNKQSSLLVENDINMRVYGINTRAQTIITAPDNASKQSADEFFRNIEAGKTSSIGTNALFEGLKVHTASTGSGGGIKDLLEYHQYLKSNLYNEVGLSSNFNMKRERLLSAEVDQSEDSLFPLVYNMLQCRLFAVEQINAMYNTEIDLDFGSVWHYKNKKLVDGVIENDDENRELVNPDIQSSEIDIQHNDTNQETDQGTEPERVAQDEAVEVSPDEAVEVDEVEAVEVLEDEEPDQDQDQDQDKAVALEPELEPELDKKDEENAVK